MMFHHAVEAVARSGDYSSILAAHNTFSSTALKSLKVAAKAHFRREIEPVVAARRPSSALPTAAAVTNPLPQVPGGATGGVPRGTPRAPRHGCPKCGCLGHKAADCQVPEHKCEVYRQTGVPSNEQGGRSQSARHRARQRGDTYAAAAAREMSAPTSERQPVAPAPPEPVVLYPSVEEAQRILMAARQREAVPPPTAGAAQGAAPTQPPVQGLRTSTSTMPVLPASGVPTYRYHF
jgi:hypothetical protein